MSCHNTAPCFLTFIVVINTYSLFKFKIFVLNTSVLYLKHAYTIPRVHNKIRGEEYPTLIVSCTNALRKVLSVNHRVLSFCINTLRETKGALIGVNSVVLGIVDTR